MYAQLPTFKNIKGGEFEMGNNKTKSDEMPVHKVKVSDFSMSEVPITVDQYKKYIKDRSLNMPEAPNWGWKENHPVVNVSWSDAINYCNWLGAILNKKVSLPTEAQWEYVAGGGMKRENFKHSGGKKINQVGWSRAAKISSTQPVKKKKPNALGIYDMNGNAWEWCMDWYDKKFYLRSEKENPVNDKPNELKSRVARGGGWDSDPETCTITTRKNYMPKSSFDDRGFRVVINPN